MSVGDKFKIAGETWTVSELPVWSTQYVILKRGKREICRRKSDLR